LLGVEHEDGLVLRADLPRDALVRVTRAHVLRVDDGERRVEGEVAPALVACSSALV